MVNNNNLLIRYTVGSAIFGLFLTIIIIKAILNSQSLLFTFSNLKYIHQDIFTTIIYFLPLIISVFTYSVIKRQNNKIDTLNQHLNKLDENKKHLQTFSEELLQGNVEVEMESFENDDKLGTILIAIRDKIKKNQIEDEKRKREDSLQNWIVEGVALFGEVLRSTNDDLKTLSYDIISNMCQYVGLIQGGIFIINDTDKNDPYFELKAHFAYNRQKYSEKTVKWNEGLIGRAANEKRIIVIDHAPNDYLVVTSGLGEANPQNLLIAPLTFNDEVHGVIELANFEPFQKHHIDFIEKVSESIGTTIRNVKINIRTTKLLSESQEQAELLSQQEEEMRQNVEELQATQEEAAKQAEHFVNFTNSVNQIMIRAEYDTNGILTYANANFLLKFGYADSSEIEGHHIGMFLGDKDRETFNNIWYNLTRGGKYYEGYMKYVTKKGHDLWTLATYTPEKDAMGEVNQILFLAIDTTEQQEKSLDFEGQIKALNIANIKADFKVSGKLDDCNEKFTTMLGYTKNDIINMSFFELFQEQSQDEIEKIWSKAVTGIPYEGQLKIMASFGKETWLQATLVAKNDMYGEVDKIILIANDITDQKELELQIQKTNKKLIAQEEKLRNSELELNKRLEKAKKDLREYFNEIENIKVRNELTLEGALDAIVMFNQKGIIEFFNKAAENLWNINKKLVIGRYIRGLFNDNTIKNNDFVGRIVSSDKEKIIGVRTEIEITTKEGENKSVLCLLSNAVVNNKHTYTAFIQNIEVELF